MRYLLLILVIVITGCSNGGVIMPFEPEDISMTYRFPITYGCTSTTRSYGVVHNITAVDTVAEVFTVAGDQSAEFGGGVLFEVSGSTGNDGDWVVAFSFFDGANTAIGVTGNITDATADGSIRSYTIPTADELRIAFWDTVTEAFITDTICTDSLQSQWTNQRCGIAWKSNGQWGVAHIEAVSNDLEYWQNAGTNFIADGAWALLDDDASENWLAVDVKTRQNWVQAEMFIAAGLYGGYINLGTGAPAWVTYSSFFADDAHYSITLDRSLFPWHIGVARDQADQTMNLFEAYNTLSPATASDDTTRVGDYPQIITDNFNNIWLFTTSANALKFDVFAPINIFFTQTFASNISGLSYAATSLTANYKAAHNPVDDTIHVILVDTIVNANLLIYMRRTANGWSSPITLATGGAGESFSWPQIACDSFNQLMVYYIHDGVLKSTKLTTALYSGFATPANWSTPKVIDDTAVIKHCNALSNMPEYK